MRKYIRHPTDIPIEFDVDDIGHTDSAPLNDISHGGLSFRSCVAYSLGTKVKVRIPIHNESFEADAVVTWCRRRRHDPEHCWDIGVEFPDGKTEFTMRMVEQVCHIEHYKNEVQATEGRELSGQEAAEEWIKKHAGKFPR